MTGDQKRAAIAHEIIRRGPSESGRWVPVAAGVLASGAVNAAYATAGGNQAIAFGEELIDSHRNMGRVVLIACLIGAAATALPVIIVALSASQEPAIFRSPAPFSAFLASIAGPAAGVALSASVALAVFNALIAQVMFNARLFFSFARDRVFPSRINSALASVHAKSGAPRGATAAVGILSAACCLLSEHTLLVFVSALVVYSLGLVSLAVIVGRRKGLTARAGYWRSPLFPLAPALGLALTIAFAVADWMDPDAGRPSLLVLGAIFAGALLWHRYVLSQRPEGWTPRLD